MEWRRAHSGKPSLDAVCRPSRWWARSCVTAFGLFEYELSRGATEQAAP
jgi:hypothetical protein